jgi:hypothetical protein
MVINPASASRKQRLPKPARRPGRNDSYGNAAHRQTVPSDSQGEIETSSLVIPRFSAPDFVSF